MIDLIFGRSFWGMVARFTLFPTVLSVISIPMISILHPASDLRFPQLTLLQQSWIWLQHMAAWSWMGWGFAFWRFDEQQRPIQSFALYPLLSGLVIIPVFWILLSLMPDSDMFDYIGATIFGAITGPLSAFLLATFCRTVPQYTALGKPT